MSNERNIIFRALISLTLIYCMGAGLYYSWNIYKDRSSGKTDFVSEWENRLARLKEELPASIESIGYIGDWDISGFDKDAYIEYILSQYTLAPIRLERGVGQEWIIANSNSPKFMEWLSSQIKKPYTYKYFGKGIYLIHQEG